MTEQIIEFRDPPSKGQADWQTVADKLRAQPNEWAFIGRHHVSVASHIKRGLTSTWRPRGTFEAVSRNSALAETGGPKNRVGDIYVRYVGDES